MYINKLKEVSVCIITLNEEKNIKRCLENLKEFEDIVVVDSFSIDRTIEICKSFHNVRVSKHKWEGYPQQKNFAISKAKYDWVLDIAADEVVTENLKKEILSLNLKNKV